MLRISLRNVIARFGRIILTSLAIIASTAFLSGTFIFRDTIERTFDALFADAFEDVDAYVQSSSTVETAFGFESRDKLPLGAVDVVAGVDGVVDAQAFVQGDAIVIDKEGEPISQRTAPSYGSTINSGELSVWRIVDGRAPSGPTEVALDEQTAEEHGFVIGDDVKVNAEGGSRTFAVVGIAQYDELSSPANATWALFDAPTASEFVVKEGFVDAVLVQGDGSITDDQLADRIQAVLDRNPDGEQEALTGLEITEQTQTEIEKGLSFFTIFLSIFSFIALGVGCFVIYNVFSISAAQRRRENALLRAVGASRRQVTRMMLLEALAVGILGSLLGLAGGIGLAIGIRSVLDALGFGIPARGLALETGTIAITMIAGIVTTLVAAIVPAIASGRVAPVAAMSETAFEQPQRTRARSIVAMLFIVVGISAIGAVVGGADGALLGVAVVAIFVGVLLLGPVMANPIATVLGAPVQRFRGVTGTMARSNVQRNPKRTARTAAPVLIGVALVTGATVFASSIKTQLRETIGSVFIGEYVINSSNGGPLSFSQEFVDNLNELPEVGDATGLGFAQLKHAGTNRSAISTTVDPSTAEGILDYDFVEGSFASLTPDGLLISSGEAEREELGVGSTVDFDVGGELRTLTVQGIYSSDELAQARVVHRDLLADSSLSNPAPFVFMTRAEGVSDEDFRVAVDAEIEAYGIGELQDREEFIDGRSDIIDQTLSFIYGLLGLSVIIAIFGIVLTMLLAVYERRRETGLLRAVGMTRAQVRTTVRWESVLTSLYGAVVGVVLGLVLGYVVIVALRDRGLDNYTVPVSAIAVIVAVAFVVGVLAAVIPARRATRFDILQAIAADG